MKNGNFFAKLIALLNYKNQVPIFTALIIPSLLVILLLPFIGGSLVPSSSDSSLTTSSTPSSEDPSSSLVVYVRGEINLNGGTTTPELTSLVEDALEVGSHWDLPTPTGELLAKENYTFEGWYFDELLTTLATNNSIDAGVYEIEVPSSDFIVYAKWVVNEVELSFYVDDVLNESLTMIVPATDEVGTLPEGPVKDGFTFVGWYRDPLDEETQVTAETVFHEDTSIYALYSEIIESPLYTFYAYHGTEAYLRGGVILSDYLGELTETSLTLPSAMTDQAVDYPVVGLGESLFSGNTNFTTYVLPSTLKSIGLGTFGWSNVTSIVLPSGLISIGSNAFNSAPLLESIVIPNTVKEIRDYAFIGATSMDSVTFEADSQLVSIGSFAFNSCVFPSIIIPKTVTEIKEASFANCSLLTSVTFEADSELLVIGSGCFDTSAITSIEIPHSVVTIDSSAFNNCQSLTHVTFEPLSELKRVGVLAFSGSAITSLELPDCVQYLGLAFIGNTEITDFTIPVDIVTIDTGAFNQIPHLDNLNQGLMDNLIYVGKQIFVDTSPFFLALKLEAETNGITEYVNWGNQFITAFLPLTTVDIVIPDGIKKIGENLFYGKTIGDVSLPSSLIEIGEECFFNSHLDSILLPNSLEIIGQRAFGMAHFTTLADIDIPATVDTLGNGTFVRAENVSSINFEVGSPITVIPDSFAYMSYSLSAITFPEGLIQIDGSAFHQTALETIVIPETVKVISSGAFANLTHPDPVFIVSGSGSFIDYSYFEKNILDFSTVAITDANGYKVFNGVLLGNVDTASLPLGVVTIPEGVRSIAASAFYDDQNITAVINASSVLESIQSSAFNLCRNVTQLDLTGGVLKRIDDYAFSTNGLSLVYIPSTVEYIGSGAFAGQNGVNPLNVTFENYSNVDFIGEWVFHDGDTTNAILEAETANASHCRIAGTTLKSCNFDSFESVDLVIPEGVTTIEASAFYEVTKLTSVSFPSTLTTIGTYAFYGTGLTSVTLPASIKDIAESAFAASLIETVTFEGVDHLETLVNAFDRTRYNINLEYTAIDGFIYDSGNGILYRYVGKETAITLPDGIKIIGKDALSYHYNLSSVTIPDTIVAIHESAFMNDVVLQTIIFEDPTQAHLNYLGAYIINNTGLEEFTIYSSTTILHREVFNSAYLLREIFVGDLATRDYIRSNVILSVYTPITVI